MTKLHEKLKELRSEKNISQKSLADFLNYKQPTIAKWENGTQEPCIKDLIKIADFFSVTVGYLVGSED